MKRIIIAMLIILCAGDAYAAPAVETSVEEVQSGAYAALAARGFTAEDIIQPSAFYPPDGTSNDVGAELFPLDSDVASRSMVERIEIVSDATHIKYVSLDQRMAMRIDTLLTKDSLPQEFQQFVEPKWDCESQARWLDSHGYVLIQTFEDGSALPDRALVGAKELGAPMTWLEARATGLIARHLNGGVLLSFIVTNEPGDQDAYVVDTGTREYSGEAVTGEMIVIPDGLYDDRVDCRLWAAVVTQHDTNDSSSSGSGGCTSGAPAYLAALAAVMAAYTSQRRSG